MATDYPRIVGITYLDQAHVGGVTYGEGIYWGHPHVPDALDPNNPDDYIVLRGGAGPL